MSSPGGSCNEMRVTFLRPICNITYIYDIAVMICGLDMEQNERYTPRVVVVERCLLQDVLYG